jgi:gamma-glutamylcyclotransferase (GGCT)/AIG2-like uncharacterized protein YtfP
MSEGDDRRPGWSSAPAARAELLALLAAANRDGRAPDADAGLDAELGHPSRRLAVYGTLRRGQFNHHLIAGIAGRWRQGSVRGAVRQRFGLPAFAWAADGGHVPVDVLDSPELPAHWGWLDAFEGAAYRRIWVPVELAEGALVVACCYECPVG